MPSRLFSMTRNFYQKVGITELLRDHGGISGKFKHLYEDFHVHEIGQDGNKIHLTALLTKGAAVEESKNTAARNSGLDFVRDDFTFHADKKKALLEKGAISTDDLERVADLVRRCASLENLLSDASVSTEAYSESEGLTKSNNLSLKHPPDWKISYPECFLYGTDEYVGMTDIKVIRKKMHSMIREFLPFLASEAACQAFSAHSLQLSVTNAPPLVRVFPKPECLKKLLSRSSFKRLLCESEKSKLDSVPNLPESHEDTNALETKLTNRNKSLSPPKKKMRVVKKTFTQELEDKCRERWDRDSGMFLWFNLWKANRDTSSAIDMIAQCLRRAPKEFSFAGIKDKRGITVQKVSVFKVSPAQLRCCVANRKWDNNVRVSNFELKQHRLQVGNLSGNHFRVVLRGLSNDCIEKVETVMMQLENNGFINYFGLQRFGTTAIGTHVIGAALLRFEWEIAVRLILGDGQILSDHSTASVSGEGTHQAACVPADKEKSRNSGLFSLGTKPCGTFCDDYLISGDASKALNNLPNHLHRERALLVALSRKKTFLESLLQMPRNALQLYIHAAQSVVFNSVASYRLKTYGDKPVIGDFVRNEVKSVKNEKVTSEKYDDQTSIAGSANFADECDNTFPHEEIQELKNHDDILQANLHRIVIPLPGDAIRYPKHLHEAYIRVSREILGLHLEQFQSSRFGFGSVPGGYRNLVVKPSGVRWTITPVIQDSAVPLLSSDVDRLQQTALCISDPLREEGENKGIHLSHRKAYEKHETSSETNVNDLDGKAAVILECGLPKSSYLTMALREVLSEEATASCEEWIRG